MNYHSWKNLPLSHSQLSTQEIALWLKWAKQYHKIPPPLLEAVMSGESHVNPSATSPAQELMQSMPGTADQLQVTKSYDNKGNIRAGTLLLRNVLQNFTNTSIALAAYNFDPNRFQDARGFPKLKIY